MHPKLASVNSDLAVVTRRDLERLHDLRLMSYSGYYLPNREGISFTDQDVEKLAQLTGLEVVGLENAPITDQALLSISRLGSLRVLDIDCTAITDTGIQYLREHPSLQILWAEQCEITDRCVPALLSCKKLCYVSLMDTQVTDSGFDRLEAKGVEVHA